MGYYNTTSSSFAGTYIQGRSKPPYRRFPRVKSGYRFYSPEIGRWLNKDPLGEEAFRTLQPGYVESRYSHGGVLANLYLFVSNNAILLVDPFGDCGAAVLISRAAQQWGPWIARGLAAAGTYIIYESSRIVKETWEEYEEKCGKCAKAGTRMEQYMETQTKLGLAGTCMCSWGPTTAFCLIVPRRASVVLRFEAEKRFLPLLLSHRKTEYILCHFFQMSLNV